MLHNCLIESLTITTKYLTESITIARKCWTNLLLKLRDAPNHVVILDPRLVDPSDESEIKSTGRFEDKLALWFLNVFYWLCITCLKKSVPLSADKKPFTTWGDNPILTSGILAKLGEGTADKVFARKRKKRRDYHVWKNIFRAWKKLGRKKDKKQQQKQQQQQQHTHTHTHTHKKKNRKKYVDF